MSNPHLPPELLDHVIDFLQNTGSALRNCCLVSKSWIPRARKHLFDEVWFETENDLELWKKAFPDPSTSPGRYTEALTIDCPHAVLAVDGEAGGWIRGFSHVVHLGLDSQIPYDNKSEIFPAVLQGLSPVVKSLTIDYNALPPSHIFDFILSFPLLEDLAITNYHYAGFGEGDSPNGLPTLVQRSNAPVIFGSLQLVAPAVEPIARLLLSVPDGIHFRKFTLAWEHDEDISLITALVERCSHTLKSLDISCSPSGMSIPRLRPYR